MLIRFGYGQLFCLLLLSVGVKAVVAAAVVVVPISGKLVLAKTSLQLT